MTTFSYQDDSVCTHCRFRLFARGNYFCSVGRQTAPTTACDYREDHMKHYLTLDIVTDGELFSIQREAPEVFAVSSGPMSMHSALIGTVSRMLEELCGEVWQAEQGGRGGGQGTVTAENQYGRAKRDSL